jgi:hypothetical protein
MVRVSVSLAVDQFETVRVMAIANRTGVSEQVRNILEWGLETIDV